jgi:hypothetical protein
VSAPCAAARVAQPPANSAAAPAIVFLLFASMLVSFLDFNPRRAARVA